MYGSYIYGSIPYGGILQQQPIVAFNPDVFQIGVNLHEPVIFTEELVSDLAIGVTLHAPTLTTLNKSIVIKVNTVDISNQVVFDSLSVSNNLFSEPNNASFEIIKSSTKTYTPTANDEVEIIDTGVTIFKGLLIKISKSMNGFIENYVLEFKDWTEELANTLVAQTYTNQTVNQIITDIFSALPAYDISNVNDTTVITQLVSDNIPITNAMDKLAEMTNKYWYVSPNKEIFFAAQNTILAPFGLTDTNGKYKYSSLIIDEDLTQIRNKVTIKGKGIAPVTVEDATSQSTYGLKEYYERDEEILATNEATQKANALLASFKDPIKVVTFRTLSEGLFAGQQITIQSTLRGINESLNIETVNFRSTFQNRFTYEVKATSQRLGRIEDLFAKVQETPDQTPAISDQGNLQTVEFSAIDDETIQWSSGNIYLADGTSYAISADASVVLTADHVIYFDKEVSLTELQISTNFADGIGEGKIPLAYATKSAVATKGASIFPIGFGGKMQIDGGVHITDRSIISDNIAANAITANEIAALTITANELAAGAVTATKISVTSLSAIVATMGTLNVSSETTGANVRIDSTNRRIAWLYDNVEKAYAYADSAGDLYIDADNSIRLVADGVGDYYYANIAETYYVTAKNWIGTHSGNWQINECDSFIVNFNSDNSGAGTYFNEDGGLCFSLDSGKDGYFADDLDINGNLSKGGGSFRIDHPLKPETHYLFHSFVESPEMLNIYKGRGKTKNRKFTIELPNYFGSLNKDFEYNLTPIGQKSILWISKEVQNNKVEVESDIDCDFSWVVYGVRQDKFALANPIIPEVEKEITGYIHPELYGETQKLSDKIISENIRRKKKGLPELSLQNKKGFSKAKSQSKYDEDVMDFFRDFNDEKYPKPRNERRKKI